MAEIENKPKKTRRALWSNIKARDRLLVLAKEGLGDKAIAKKLLDEFGYAWSPRTVELCRQKAGVVYTTSDAKKRAQHAGDQGMLSTPPAEIPPEEKAEWFRSRFKKTHLYQLLIEQFTVAETTVYLQEYGIVCCQFENLVTSEFFSIDDFLKHRLLINRQLKMMKELQAGIDGIEQWLQEHPPKPDEQQSDMNERKQKTSVMNNMLSSLGYTNKRYDELAKERDHIYSSLAATRKDRIDKIADTTESFLKLVAGIQQDDAMRTKHGQYAALSKLAADESAADMRKVVTFPDGSKDAILLDDVLVDEEEANIPDAVEGDAATDDDTLGAEGETPNET